MATKTLGRNWWIDRKGLFAEERNMKAKGDAAAEEKAIARLEEQQKEQGESLHRLKH
jgi:hypothetical protein